MHVQPPGGSAPGDVKSARPAKSTLKESKLNWITNRIKKADTKPLHPISPLTPFTQREKAKLPKGVFFKALEKAPVKLKAQKTTKLAASQPARVAVITRRASQ